MSQWPRTQHESGSASFGISSSKAHKEIVRHARALKGAKAEVKLYDLVQ